MGCSVAQHTITSQILIGFALAASAFLKFRAPDAIAGALEALGIPARLAGIPTVWLVIGFEGMIGVLVLAGRQMPAASVGAGAFFVAATAALVRLRRIGFRGSCACFGRIDRHGVGVAGLARNVVLLAAALDLTGVFALRHCVGTPVWAAEPSAAVFAGFATAVMVAAYVCCSKLEQIANEWRLLDRR